MGSLKPIGSEKLKGQEKINRILEISKYGENFPNSVNESSRNEYSINLSDGNDYVVVKEKQGYIIKRNINESTSEYIEPMKNRKYYSSYSQALKRLNLLASELNKLNENEEEISLFGEQKKFTLKTPKPKMDKMPEVPAEPAALPEPSLPEPQDMGGLPADDDMDLDLSVDNDDADMDIDMDMDMGDDEDGDKEERVSFKTIQKLTGKLTQKIRMFEQEEGMTSENMKYVINMVLSSLELDNLSEEDKEDIFAKFEEESEDMGDMDMGDMEGEDMGDMDMGDVDLPDMGGEMEEDYGAGAIIDSIFNESKVDSVISNYFEFTKKELLGENQKKLEKEILNFSHNFSEISRLSETEDQKNTAIKFMNNNPKFELIGITNKKNLVFENKQIRKKITPEGFIIK